MGITEPILFYQQVLLIINVREIFVKVNWNFLKMTIFLRLNIGSFPANHEFILWSFAVHTSEVQTKFFIVIFCCGINGSHI